MRATKFDLGWGDRQYKRIVCNQSRQDGPLFLYALSWNGLKLNFLRSIVSFLDVEARKALAKSTFFQKAKKLWQSRLQKLKSSTHSLEREGQE
jgi:CelD/BcsL family acetyltransferase involved in cellulose biosynthesis